MPPSAPGRARLPGRYLVAALVSGLLALLLTQVDPNLLAGREGQVLGLHLLIELLSVVVSAQVVMAAWHVLPSVAPRMSNVLVAGFTLVAGCDLLHALSYPGMPELITSGSTSKSIFFWLLGRSAEVAALLLLACRVRLPGRALHWLLGSLALLGVLLVWGTLGLDYFPTTFIPGHGLTSFKFGFETALSLANLLAAALLWHGARRTPQPMVGELIAAALLMVLSEICFTRYQSSFDTQVLLGHAFKIAAYVLIYRATFQVSVREPLRRLAASEADLRQSLREVSQLQVALDEHAIVAITDPAGRIIMVNDKFCSISGYRREELLGQNHRILNSGHHPRAFFETLWRTIRSGQVWHGEICNRTREGHLYWVQTTIMPFLDEAGQPQRYVSIRADITAHKRSEEAMRDMAFHDQLTGLPNRRQLMEQLQQSCLFSERHSQYGALLFIDLDQFKYINDTHGHQLGDELLCAVAARLQHHVRASDIVARMGGDEFVVLLSELGTDRADAAGNAAHLAQALRQALAAPHQLHGLELVATPSIGATVYFGQQYSASDLFKQADMAMYEAKARGRNAVAFYDPALQAAAVERLSVESALRQAIQGGQLRIYYQPLCNAHGARHGAECLVRWQHPEQGMMSPALFIPIAEKSNLIVELGTWMLEQACRQLAAWDGDARFGALQLAVNVSGREFRQDDFVERMLHILAAQGVSPTRLKLEVTESVLMANLEQAKDKLHKLRAAGIRIALDDFGTGYSSLAYLRQLPIDVLKIDQSFVRAAQADERSAAIVATIVALAHNLQLTVVAEGVETPEQLALLRKAGCHLYQGYLFGRPQPIQQFMDECDAAALRTPTAA